MSRNWTPVPGARGYGETAQVVGNTVVRLEPRLGQTKKALSVVEQRLALFDLYCRYGAVCGAVAGAVLPSGVAGNCVAGLTGSTGAVAAGGLAGAVASMLGGVAVQNALTRTRPTINANTSDPNSTLKFMPLRSPWRASVVSKTVGFVTYDFSKMKLLLSRRYNAAVRKEFRRD